MIGVELVTAWCRRFLGVGIGGVAVSGVSCVELVQLRGRGVGNSVEGCSTVTTSSMNLSISLDDWGVICEGDMGGVGDVGGGGGVKRGGPELVKLVMIIFTPSDPVWL